MTFYTEIEGNEIVLFSFVNEMRAISKRFPAGTTGKSIMEWFKCCMPFQGPNDSLTIGQGIPWSEK